MPEGIQILNDSNIVQIDSNYYNLALRAEGYIGSYGYYMTSGGSRMYEVTFAANEPVVVAALTHVPVRVHAVYFEGGYWHAKILTANTDDAYGVAFYIYDLPVAAGVSDGGFEVYRPDGGLAFSAAQKYMRVVGFNTLPAIPGGNTFGVMPSTTQYRVFQQYESTPYGSVQLWVYLYVKCYWNGGGVVSQGELCIERFDFTDYYGIGFGDYPSDTAGQEIWGILNVTNQ